MISVLDITTIQTFNNELLALESWLVKSSSFLEDLSKDNVTNNVEETEHKLEQIRSFSQEMDKTKPQIEVFRELTNKIFEKSEPNFASLLNNKLEAVAHKWTILVDRVKNLSDKYEGALKKNDDVSTKTV